MSSSSGLFEVYEKDYCNAATSLADALSRLNGIPIEERKLKAKKLDKTVKEAEQILQRLDMEARSAPPDKSNALLQKVKEYRADISKLKDDVKRASTASFVESDARAELGLSDSYYETSAGQRERLLSATDRLSKTSERIQQGRRQLLETEALGAAILSDLERQKEVVTRSRQHAQNIDASELGVSVLSDLQRQRETIMHSRDTLGTIDSNIDRARDILGRMSRRIVQNKVIMWGVIALLAGSIGLIIYAKLT